MSRISERIKRLNDNPVKLQQQHRLGDLSDDLRTKMSEMQCMVDELTHIAYHDTLTGLPNRRCFEDTLERAIIQAEVSSSQLAVMFIDMDRFKQINDTCGHDAGDALLKLVAVRMQQAVGDAGFCARLAGDEFVVIIPKYRDEADVNAIARALLENLQPPFSVTVNGEPLELESTPSIGASLYPHSATTSEELVKAADEAMYRVKQNGKNNVCIHRKY